MIKRILLIIILLAVLSAAVLNISAIIQKIGASDLKLESGTVDNQIDESENEPVSKQNIKNVIFSIDSNASVVEIAGDFTYWKKIPMKKRTGQNWYSIFELKPGSYGYVFYEDNKLIADPSNLQRAKNPLGEICSIKNVK